MNAQAWLMVALLVIMFALLVWGKLLTWLVFIGTLTIVMTLKLAPLDDLLSGFSNPGVITRRRRQIIYADELLLHLGQYIDIDWYLH